MVRMAEKIKAGVQAAEVDAHLVGREETHLQEGLAGARAQAAGVVVVVEMNQGQSLHSDVPPFYLGCSHESGTKLIRGGRQNPGNNLHVSGLSTKVDTRDLEAAFAKIGRVWHIQLCLRFANMCVLRFKRPLSCMTLIPVIPVGLGL